MVERVKDARSHVWHDASRDRSIIKREEFSAPYDRELEWQFLTASGNPDSGLKAIMPHSLEPPFETDIEREAAILVVASKQLFKLIRFERRAANQRDRALRRLAQIEVIGRQT
jgi:hypothetical protein